METAPRPVTTELDFDRLGEHADLDSFDEDTRGRPRAIGDSIETATVDISRDRRATTTSLGPVRSLAHRGVGRPLHRLMDVVLLVKPETVVGWHRAAGRLIWRWRSQRPPGRPPSMRISANSSGGCGASPTWGQQIIAAELAKLGYQVSPRTVAKYRPSDLDRQRGQQVQQILATFQMEALGGGGYLRLVRFSSAERRVTDRSDLFAISGQVQNDPDNNFTLDY